MKKQTVTKKAARKKVASTKLDSKKVVKKTRRQAKAAETLRPTTTHSGSVVIAGWCVPTSDRPYLIERMLTPSEQRAEYELRREELDKAQAHAEEVLAKWLPELRQHPDYVSGHITGVSIGFRRKFGHPVSPLQINIIVNVATKLDAEELASSARTSLPQSVYGVPIKVLEGTYNFLSASTTSSVADVSLSQAGGITTPINPLPFTIPLIGGVPIAPPTNHAGFGTLGVVLGGSATGVGVTNCHVIRSGPAVQIGPDFPGGANPARSIGNVVRSHLGGITADMQGLFGSVDCASVSMDVPFTPDAIRGITHTDDGTLVAGSAEKLFYLTGDSIVGSEQQGFPVWKFGGSSGTLLMGDILHLNTNPIGIPEAPDFINNFSVQHSKGNGHEFVRDGDSGSLVVMRASIDGKDVFVVIGLIYAALKNNSSIGIACHFSDVVKALRLTIPDGHALTW